MELTTTNEKTEDFLKEEKEQVSNQDKETHIKELWKKAQIKSKVIGKLNSLGHEITNTFYGMEDRVTGTSADKDGFVNCLLKFFG